MSWTVRFCCCAVAICLTLAASAQQRQAMNAGEKGRQLFYVGLGLYSERWSEDDVVELAGQLQQTSKYNVVPLIASNVTSPQRHYPVADDANIANLIDTAAKRAGPNDLVFVDISSHGGPEVLARKVGNGQPTEMSSRGLARRLAPLAGHRTVIVVSACYSGSLIRDLRAPERIIITAARADRSSFGCSPDSRHTFFGEAELRAFGTPDRSLDQVFAAIQQEVARMERRERYTPSEPQVSVGSEVADLYHAPLF